MDRELTAMHRDTAAGDPGLPLAALLEDESRVLTGLLEATRGARAAARRGDAGALDRAVAAREEGLRQLARLESRAAELRAGQPAPPPELVPHIERLGHLVREFAAADRDAQAAAGDALDTLRAGLRTVTCGQRGMRGYRPHPDRAPRFTDRRG